MSSGIYNDADTDEDDDLLKLKEEVETMAETLRESREIIPNQLASTFSTLVASHGTVLPTTVLHEDPQPDALTCLDQVTDEAEESEKIQVLKQKIESNSSKLPIVLNRIEDCIARIDKLESSNGTIHPPFKRRRSSRLNP